MLLPLLLSCELIETRSSSYFLLFWATKFPKSYDEDETFWPIFFFVSPPICLDIDFLSNKSLLEASPLAYYSSIWLPIFEIFSINYFCLFYSSALNLWMRNGFRYFKSNSFIFLTHALGYFLTTGEFEDALRFYSCGATSSFGCIHISWWLSFSFSFSSSIFIPVSLDFYLSFFPKSSVFIVATVLPKTTVVNTTKLNEVVTITGLFYILGSILKTRPKATAPLMSPA